MKKGQRREEILQALVGMLQSGSVGITTARLAQEVGVSEAALYRHFPSKARMYDALLDFIEDALFSRLNLILQNEGSADENCRRMAELVLAFAAANPGLARILTGHALVGEDERLRMRTAQIFARLEAQFRQVIREAELAEGLRPRDTLNTSVNMLTAMIDGKLQRFVRQQFAERPDADWNREWALLAPALFREKAAA